MRVWRALKADMKFQFKQGFYTVYVFLTLIYMVIIIQLPKNIVSIAVPLVVFTDPSVVGFFFIGGIIMLEKVQGVIQYIVVTPLTSKEYLAAKIISLSLLAEAAGITITAVTYKGNISWVLLVLGILLSSVFFTLYGFIIAAGCNTVNEYFIKMIPYMLVIVFPCFSLIGFHNSWLFNIFPSVAGIKLVFGAFHGVSMFEAISYIIYLLIFNAILFLRVERIFDEKIVYGG